MGKKQKSTQTINQSTTPIAPAGTSEALSGLFGTINTVRGMDPRDLVAPSNPWLDQAGTMAANYGTASKEALTGLDKILTSGAPQATASSGLENLSRWFDPYLDRVVETSLAQFDENAAAENAAEDLALAKGGAFAGSGGAIVKALASKGRTMGRAALDAGLRSEGFKNAAGYSSADAERKTQASIANAQIGAQHQALMANTILQKAGILGDLESGQIAALGTMGGLFRDIDNQQRQAPLTLAGFEADLLRNATPLAALLTGQNTTGTQTGKQSGSGFGIGWSFKDGLNVQFG